MKKYVRKAGTKLKGGITIVSVPEKPTLPENWQKIISSFMYKKYKVELKHELIGGKKEEEND